MLAGECLLLIEGEERPLRQWDFVHCPPWTEHVFVGAGDGPCVILMVGARNAGDGLIYPVSETARYGTSVEKRSTSRGLRAFRGRLRRPHAGDRPADRPLRDRAAALTGRANRSAHDDRIPHPPVGVGRAAAGRLPARRARPRAPCSSGWRGCSSQDGRVIAYDLRGHGRSPWSGPHTIEQHVDDLDDGAGRLRGRPGRADRRRLRRARIAIAYAIRQPGADQLADAAGAADLLRSRPRCTREPGPSGAGGGYASRGRGDRAAAASRTGSSTRRGRCSRRRWPSTWWPTRTACSATATAASGRRRRLDELSTARDTAEATCSARPW